MNTGVNTGEGDRGDRGMSDQVRLRVEAARESGEER